MGCLVYHEITQISERSLKLIIFSGVFNWFPVKTKENYVLIRINQNSFKENEFSSFFSQPQMQIITSINQNLDNC